MVYRTQNATWIRLAWSCSHDNFDKIDLDTYNLDDES